MFYPCFGHKKITKLEYQFRNGKWWTMYQKRQHLRQSAKGCYADARQLYDIYKYIIIVIYIMQLRLALPSLSQTRWSVLQYQCRVICQLSMFFQSQMLTLEGTLLLKTLQLLANTHLTSFTFNQSFVCFHFPQFHTPGKHHRTLHQHPLKVPQGIPQCPDLTGETWWKAWIMTNLHHLCSAFGTWPRELCRLEFTRNVLRHLANKYQHAGDWKQV